MHSNSVTGDEEELVFLSPEWEQDPDKPDQGASPKLRRSSRKRKSVASEESMSKGNSAKKKKNSPSKNPSPDKEMAGGKQDAPASTPTQQTRTPSSESVKQGMTGITKQAASGITAIEKLLRGMENRLSTKIDATNAKVDKALALVADTNIALEDLELKVAVTEEALNKELGEAEKRIHEHVDNKVKTMVLDQLRSAGFDPDLTAGALTTIQNSYATAVSLPPASMDTSAASGRKSASPSKEDRRSAKFLGM